MLAILIAHTLILSLWLAEDKPIKTQANFKIDENHKESSKFHLLKATEDSLQTTQPVFSINLGSHIK